jgi:argininosuccinate synthase
MSRIVLAYSGGLDTSVAIRWLAREQGDEVVAVTLDIGQGRELEHVRARALAAGAVRCHVIDARDELAREFVLPALMAGAMYEGQYPLATALARPLIARHLVQVARMEGASVVAHGGTAKGNNQVRLELSIRALAPDLQVIAPAREWGMTRDEEIAYARAHGLAVLTATDPVFSVDANLWGRSIQCGVLDDPWTEAPSDIFTLTREPAACAGEPAFVQIDFERGVPSALNGIPMDLVDLIDAVGTIAGDHGVGRIDMVENRIVGIKSREIYEAPAAVALHAAHADLQRLVTMRDLARLTTLAASSYADLVYDGRWFTPAREALDAFVQKVQERVTGRVRLKLFHGDVRVVGRSSPHSLYDQSLATQALGDRFDRRAADGFVRLLGLPVEAAARAGRVDPTPARVDAPQNAKQ